MRHAIFSAGLSTLCIPLALLRIQAKDLYVSPDGTPLGPGTMSQPYDLATALLGHAGQAGDTFWLRGGNYSVGRLSTSIQGAPGQAITFRGMPGEKPRIDGTFAFFDSIGYVVLRDFELYSSDTNRASSQIGVGFNVTDINIIPGIGSYSAPNLSFINLIVHDHTRHGFYISQTSTNNVIYGCVVYNNGWVSPDNAEGHGLYVQGAIETKEVSDNLVFNNSGANVHIYENFTNSYLRGVTLDGNVAFNAGAIQNVRDYRDWIVGVDSPAVGADRMVFKNNMGYYSPGSSTLADVQIGRDGTNGNVVLTDNYMPLGLQMNNWRTATVSGNLFGSGAGYAVNLDQSLTSLEANWNGNIYLSASTGNDFILNSEGYSFAEWQAVTGFDGANSYHQGNPTGTRVFVRPNRYETGRAHIVVYNWDNLSAVEADVSSVLPVGVAYEVRNAQDFFAPPVLSGVFDGKPLLLPMTGLTVAAPNGPLRDPPPTGPTFNLFVLLPCWNRLGIQEVNGAVKLWWKTNCGPFVLQFKDGLSVTNVWADVATDVAVDGDQYVVTNSATGAMGFYRLRSQ